MLTKILQEEDGARAIFQKYVLHLLDSGFFYCALTLIIARTITAKIITMFIQNIPVQCILVPHGGFFETSLGLFGASGEVCRCLGVLLRKSMLPPAYFSKNDAPTSGGNTNSKVRQMLQIPGRQQHVLPTHGFSICFQ